MGDYIVTIQAVWHHEVVVEAQSRQEAENQALEHFIFTEGPTWSESTESKIKSANVLEVEAVA